MLDPMYSTPDPLAFQTAIPPHWNARGHWPPQDQTAQRRDSLLTPSDYIWALSGPIVPTPPLLASQTPVRGGPGAGAHLWPDALLDARPDAGRRGKIPKSPSQPFPRDLETTPEKKPPSPWD